MWQQGSLPDVHEEDPFSPKTLPPMSPPNHIKQYFVFFGVEIIKRLRFHQFVSTILQYCYVICFLVEFSVT